MGCNEITIIQVFDFYKVPIEAQAFIAQEAATLDPYGSNYKYRDHSVACVV